MHMTDRDAKIFPTTEPGAQSGGEIFSDAYKGHVRPLLQRLVACFFIVLTTVLAGGATAYANELRELPVQREVVPAADAANLNYRRGLAVDAASIGDADGVRFSGYVAEPPPCACTNLNFVSVICDDCDSAADESQCFRHDSACQDAALAGGIREHATFFCTSPN